MIIGAILQTAAVDYAMMIVARIITGLGNGLNVSAALIILTDEPIITNLNICSQTSTVPSYHAECSPATKRGAFIMLEGSLITFGIMLSYVFQLYAL